MVKSIKSIWNSGEILNKTKTINLINMIGPYIPNATSLGPMLLAFMDLEKTTLMSFKVGPWHSPFYLLH